MGEDAGRRASSPSLQTLTARRGIRGVKPEQPEQAGAPHGRDQAAGRVRGLAGRRSRMVAVVAIAMVVAAGCAHKPSVPQRHRLDGVYIVHGIFSHRNYGTRCNPADAGYPDIRPGTAVTVRDGTRAVLGTAALEAGTLRRSPLRGRDDDCVFSFSLTVRERDSYRIEVGSRGAVEFSRADLERANWKADLTIGAYTMFGGD
jgi:hypothetical protein